MAWSSNAWGSATWAGLRGTLSGTGGGEPSHGLDIQIDIGGIEQTDKLAIDSFVVNEDLENRNIFEFTLVDETMSYHPEVGLVVRAWYNNILMFAGTIDEVVEEIGDEWSTALFLHCTAVDWNQLADRHVVAARYDTDDQTLSDVVTAIANTDSGDIDERLTDEGVTLGGVLTGPEVSTIAFNYQNVAECYDELAELTGYSWNIDYHKDLKFFDPTTYWAPYELDDAKWQEYRAMRVTRTREKYRNLQYLMAGNATSNTRSEFFQGDGETKTFTVSMPVADVPALAIDSGSGFVAVSAGDVDIRRDDTEQENEWFYQIGDKSISANSDDDIIAALTSGQTLRVTYKGWYPILDQARNDAQIGYRKQIESDAGVATGVYTEVEEDDSIDDTNLAIERINGLLRRHSQIEDTVVFQTDVDGFLIGQRLRVNMPDINATGDYLITNVRKAYIEDTLLRYDITAVKGESQGGWADFYKRLARKGRPFTIRESDSLLLLRERASTLIVGDAQSLTDPLQAWGVDIVTHWIFGQSKIGGRRDSAVNAADTGGVVFGPAIGFPYS
jgi:hypothetical protein